MPLSSEKNLFDDKQVIIQRPEVFSFKIEQADDEYSEDVSGRALTDGVDCLQAAPDAIYTLPLSRPRMETNVSFAGPK